MRERFELLYESPAEYPSYFIQSSIAQLLRESGEDLRKIVKKRCKAASISAEQTSKLANTSPGIIDKGAGVDATTVALAVSLAPLVKAIIPVLKPFAKDASAVAKVITLDIWEMLKRKLWQKQHVRLREKGNSRR